MAGQSKAPTVSSKVVATHFDIPTAACKAHAPRKESSKSRDHRKTLLRWKQATPPQIAKSISKNCWKRVIMCRCLKEVPGESHNSLSLGPKYRTPRLKPQYCFCVAPREPHGPIIYCPLAPVLRHLRLFGLSARVVVAALLFVLGADGLDTRARPATLARKPELANEPQSCKIARFHLVREPAAGRFEARTVGAQASTQAGATGFPESLAPPAQGGAMVNVAL